MIALAELKERIKGKLAELDGLVALRRTSEGTAPYLFQPDSDLDGLALEPKYPLASILVLLQKRYPEANFGIVVHGCDTRAMVEMAKRQQLDLERVYLFGVACSAEEAQECNCAEPAPVVGDWVTGEVIGDIVAAAPANPMVARYAEMNLEARRQFWQQQFLKCIKCYGCRDICPECFCEACALEDPLWVERGVLAPPFPTFHLIRAMHMATRCVGCRQCEEACPAHIPLTVLYDLIRGDVTNLLGYSPGANTEQLPPLSLSLSDAPLIGDDGHGSRK